MRIHISQRYVRRNAKILLIIALSFPLINVIAAQEKPLVQCGEEIEAEISQNEKYAGHAYLIAVRPGDTLDITVKPIGSSFDPDLIFNDGGNYVYARNSVKGATEQITGLVVSSSNPSLEIDTGIWNTVGGYTLSIGCTLRDGTVINPGDTPRDAAGVVTVPTFSGTGFPGLPPVDFANVAKLPLPQASLCPAASPQPAAKSWATHSMGRRTTSSI